MNLKSMKGQTLFLFAIFSVLLFCITTNDNAFAAENDSVIIYNKQVNETGLINAESKDSIWADPYHGRDTSFVSSPTKYNGSRVQIVREAETNYGIYYQFKIDNQVIGWLDKQCFDSIGQINHNNPVSLSGQVNAGKNDGIWAEPYQGSGMAYISSGSQYNGKRVEIIREAQTNYGTYYQFQTDSKTVGWLDKKAFTSITTIDYNKEVNNTGVVRANASDSIWQSPYQGDGTGYVTSGSQYNGRQVRIIREAKTDYGTYDQIETDNNKILGWIDQKAVTVDQIYTNKEVSFSGQIHAGSSDGIWTDPYMGMRTHYVTSGSLYDGQRVQVVREAQTNYGTYYQFKENDKVIGWLDKKAFRAIGQINYNNDVHLSGQIHASDQAGIWSEPYQGDGTPYVAPGTRYNTGQRVQIIREAQTNYGTYYQFQSNNETIGWLDKTAFGAISEIYYNNSVNQNGQIQVNDNGGIWADPYQGDGTSYVVPGITYNYHTVHVIREAKTNYGTYYQIQINGQTIGWIDKNDVVPVISSTTTKYNYSFDYVVNKQSGAKTDKTYSMYIYKDALQISGSKATIVDGPWNIRGGPGTNYWVITTINNGTQVSIAGHSGDWYQISYKTEKWVNASPKDIRQAMDPKSYSPDSTEYYQFLKLSSPTYVNADEVNEKVLKGKGILEGKASDFIQAAKNENINELYLISHALLETGNGTSRLATGIVVDHVDGQPVEPKKVYNMFGIGASDQDAERLGAETAYKNGWFSLDSAILGGAKFIGQYYIHNSYNQDTLYKMRWNPVNPGIHQYASDIGWAVKQTYAMKKMYDLLSNYSIVFDVPKYNQ
ncbi:GW domain-containing glycosaminoglycan-binding protein [Sporolactobacillus inulinus]|uniref:GW domain-containing glycosaminoglycan-binding protein n=1 Tax=Sporolactobacillus inulinus TaxID=2078 RepID=UPI00069AC9F5|nr:GW domain-containing glycosaminoglycan-binding protein [Sporolactobacillus inulinus]GEB77511.1 hypothetical protein SIN01_18560 [Sporolactobacillus inulinus]